MGHYATEEQLVSLVSDMASKINIASGTQGVSGSYVPIGFIEAFMGTTAPPDFLACDGSLHQISQYPDLADHFYEQFGASNYFGGNGTTTFAVPDLRGEFLRGTGTNSHTNQGDGEDVGDHQDGTLIPSFSLGATGNILCAGTDISPSDQDFATQTLSDTRMTTTSSPGGTRSVAYTSRPTNTSILWCIKAIDEKIEHGVKDYSTSEQNTGVKYTDGKDIYQKYIECGTWTTGGFSYAHGIANIDRPVSIEAYAYASSSHQILSLNSKTADVYFNRTNIVANGSATGAGYVITAKLLYTKLSS